MQTQEAELDIMAALRSGTATQHKEVEQLMPFFKPGFTLEQYTDILAAFLGFFEPLEIKLATLLGHSSMGINLPSRQRACLIRNDLRSLGLSTLAIGQLPRCEDLPELKSSSNAFGCLYVLEGSTLGGQLIARELSRCFNIDETTGASFFLSHGTHTGEMWKEFCGVIRQSVNDPAKRNAAIDSARDTFVKFDSWIRKVSMNAD